LAECGRAAAHEKSAREHGREPETFHDSDELTNLAVAAQQNVRDCIAARIGITLIFRLNDAIQPEANTEDFY
jgi:hypothetical protein